MSATNGRAAVLERFNEPLAVREFPVPQAGPGALVTRIDAATVCGSDLHIWANHLGGTYTLPLPLVLGHEMVGVIEQIGDGAELDSMGRPLSVGDRVVWANEGCGRCRECTVLRQTRLCTRRRLVGLTNSTEPPHFVGAFAEYGYVTPGQGRVRVPDEVRSSWASAGSCALRTVVNTVEAAGRIDYNDTVVVQGAGPLGLFATALVSVLGPRELVVVGAPDDRLDLAKAWGATATVSVERHPDPEARLEAVLEATGGIGPTVALEVSGAPGAFAEGVQMLRPAGRYVVSGTVGGPAQAVDVSRITTRGLQISGSMSGDVDSYDKAMTFLERHRDRFDWDRLIGSPYSLAQVTDALSAMQAMEQIKPVIDPSLPI